VRALQGYVHFGRGAEHGRRVWRGTCGGRLQRCRLLVEIGHLVVIRL
jgi:hypothetical protein